MSTQARNLKRGQFIYHNNQVFEIVDLKNHVKSGHSIHFTVQDFATNHQSEKTFGLTHNVRLVEPSHLHYKLSHLLDEDDDGNQYLCLVDKDLKPREDLSVNDPHVIKQLKEYLEKNEDEEELLKVHVTQVHVDPLHRIDKAIDLTKVTGIQKIDMKHLYDHHHNKHHH